MVWYFKLYAMVQAPRFIWKPAGTAFFDNVKPFLIRSSGMSFQSKSLLIQKDLKWLLKQVPKWFEVKWSETCISHRRCIDNSTLCLYYRTVWLFQRVGGLFSAYEFFPPTENFVCFFLPGRSRKFFWVFLITKIKISVRVSWTGVSRFTGSLCTFDFINS